MLGGREGGREGAGRNERGVNEGEGGGRGRERGRRERTQRLHRLRACACEECPAGTFQGSSGQVECGSCLSGKYSESCAVQCQSCLENSNSWARSGWCFCNAGYTDSGHAERGAARCLQCPDGKTSSARSEAEANCTCPAGFSGIELCVACEAGKFKGTAGSGPCVACPAGSISLSLECAPFALPATPTALRVWCVQNRLN